MVLEMAVELQEPESSYRGNFRWLFDQGKWNLVWVSGEFELSEFELTE